MFVLQLPFRVGFTTAITQAAFDTDLSHGASFGGDIDFGSSVDFAASVRTEIIAPYDGTVVSVYYASTKTEQSSLNRSDYGPIGLGNIITVKHSGPDGEFYATYAHLDPTSERLSQGDQVSQGETILGLVGVTGFSTGPHLHMTINQISAGLTSDSRPYTGTPMEGTEILTTLGSDPNVRVALDNTTNSFGNHEVSWIHNNILWQTSTGLIQTPVESIDPNTQFEVEHLQEAQGVSLISGLGGAAGFGEQLLSANDDGSTEELDIRSIFEDGINFFGNEFSSLFVNNNGSVTFNLERSAFTPEVITGVSNNPEITPYFADVDTRGGAVFSTPSGNSTGSNLVYYDFDEVNDRFIVTWDDVGYYNSQTNKLNAFQLILTDQGSGDFDIEFRYEDINWTTGDFSGGDNGLDGQVARAGYTAGTGDPAAFFELPASGNQDAMLALDETAGNTGDIGRWVFNVRSGDVFVSKIPSLPTPDFNGWIVGDPHISTLDGVGYDFQAAGEFVLLRGKADPAFEIQARMIPIGNNVSVASAVATTLDGVEVVVDANDSNPLYIDGIATAINNFSSVDVNNDRIFREDNTYTVVYAGEDNIVNAGDSQLIVDVLNNRIGVDVHINTELAGDLEGLMSDGDGSSANDIAFADGSVLDRPLAFEDLYGQYRDDWRVSDNADSLFVYDSGESLAGFYLPDYPSKVMTLDDLEPAVRQVAEQAVQDQGLLPGTINFNNAVLDFALTGDSSYIASSRSVTSINESNFVSVMPPSLNVNVGGGILLNEGDMFTRIITFTDGEDASNDGWTYSVDYGDGSAIENGIVTAGFNSFGINHIYTDGDVNHNVSVTVTDTAEDSNTEQFAVTINNVAPIIALSGNSEVNTNAPYSLNLGAVTDPGVDRVTSYIVNWGDGSSDTYATVGDVTHVFSTAGNTTVSIDLVDEDGTHTRAGTLDILVNPVSVLNENLIVNGGAETGDTSGWVSTGIDAISPDALAQGFGAFTFTGGTGPATQTLFQSIDVSGSTSQIDTGQIQSAFSINLQSRTNNVLTDLARVDVSYIDNAGVVLDAFSFIDNENLTAGHWKSFSDIRVVPVGTKSIEILLTTNRNGGSSSDGFFDEVSLKLSEVVVTEDIYNTISGLPFSVDALAGVLSNDSGSEGSVLTTSLVNDPSHGALNLNADGSFSYSPEAGFAGTDNFTYRAFDGTSFSTPTNVAIAVSPISVSNPSVVEGNTGAQQIEFSIQLEQPLLTDLVLNYQTLDGTAKAGEDYVAANDSVTIPAGQTEATIQVAINGDTDLETDETFTLAITPQGGAETFNATATIIADDVQQPPVAEPDAYSVTNDSTLTVSVIDGVLVNDSDAEDDVLTAAVVAEPSQGVLNLNADGSFSYTPNAGFDGVDTFIYRAFDGTDFSMPATVSITVDPPVIFAITGELTVPESLNPGGIGTSQLVYENNSSTAIPGTLVLAQAIGGGLLADPLTGEYSDGIFLLGLGDGDGTVQVTESGSLSFSTKMADAPNGSMTVSAAVADPSQTIDWAALETQLKPESMSDTLWHRIYTNFQSEVGTTAGEFIATLTENGQYLSSLGVRSDSATAALSFELEQAGDFGSLVERETDGTAGRGWTFLGDLRLDIAVDGNAVLQGSTLLGTLFTLNAEESAYYTVSSSVGQTVGLSGNVLGGVAPTRPLFSKNINGSYTTAGDFDGQLIRTADGFRLENSHGDALLFDQSGAFVKAITVNGQETSAAYDAAGRITDFTGPNGNALTINRDAAGNVVSMTDANAQTVMLGYSADGDKLVAATGASGTANFSYDGNGDLSQATAAGEPDIDFAYDSAGRLVSVSVAGGIEQTTFSYDSFGGYTITDGAGRTAHISLAPGGQVANITDGSNATASLHYSTQGELTGVEFPDGTTAAITVDDLARPTALTDANGATLTYTYHNNFNVPISFTDANGATRAFSYNDQGEMVQAAWTDGTHLDFNYNEEGQIANFSNRRGESATYDYDARGRLTVESDGTSGAVNYTYDAAGNLLTATTAEGTTSLTYDPADRVTKIEYSNGRSLSYNYDAAGNRTSMTDQDGNAQFYQYDAAGRLINLSNNNGTLVSYTYDAAGKLVREDNGNGTATTYSYDAAGRLLEIHNLDATGNENSHIIYSYDTVGQRIGMETVDGFWVYGYDAVGQLTSAHFTSTRAGLADKQIEYVYDAAGNRISKTEDGVTTHYTVNALNQYVTVGDTNLSYDADGNLIAKIDSSATWSYTYDIENRLTSVTTPTGDATQYEYDVFGNRSALIENGARTEFLIDPFGLGDVVGEYAGDGSLIASYANGVGLASRIANDGSAAYYDVDGVGSVIGVTDGSGNEVNRYGYTPFGNKLFENETIANSFEFNGALGVSEDVNDLTYMRARFYDSEMGRFLSEDPLWLDGDVANLYRFANNDTASLADPSGEFVPFIIGAIRVYLILSAASDTLLTAYDYHQNTKKYVEFKMAYHNCLGKNIVCEGLNETANLAAKNASFDLLKLAGAGVISKYKLVEKFLQKGIKGLHELSKVDEYILKIADLVFTKILLESPFEKFLANLFFGKDGSTTGDPHLYTFDGFNYDFQAAGEFTLVQGTDPGLGIQVRQEPWGNNSVVSINTAVAMQVGDDVVGIYRGQPNPININGEFVAIADGETVAVGDGSIFRQGKNYVITNEQGDGFWARVGSFIDVGTFLSTERSGEIAGLLGNADGDKTNDIALADGTVLTGPLTKQDLYGPFADSWRVTPETSLFVYGDSESTETFTIPNFPLRTISVNDLDPAVRAAAEEAVRNVSLTEGTIEFENAVLDVALTGEIEFALAALEMLQIFGPSIGLSLNVGEQAQLNEGDTFSRLITFTDDADSGDAGRTYSIDWGDGSVIETGAIATGIQSFDIARKFTDGDASQIVSITVTDGSDDTVTQQFTVNVDNVSPTIALSGAPEVNTGDSYTLNLGVVTDPGDDTVTSYIVDWGDGSTETFATAGDVTHTYTTAGSKPVIVDLVDEDGSHTNAGNIDVVVNAPIETIQIGDAPLRVSRSDPNAWENAWTDDSVDINHKADYTNAAETWSNITLSGRSSTALSGGDMFGGDLGVSGQSLASSTIRQEIDGTEALRFDLTEAATSVTVDLSRLEGDTASGNFDAGRLQLLDGSGLVIDELPFSAAVDVNGQLVTLSHDTGFSSVVLTSGVYNGADFVFGGLADNSGLYQSDPQNLGDGTWNGSDYLVDAIAFEFGEITLVGTVG